ncbi:MAG: RNA-binding S4 domain-containing protein [candidate division Zixibacteria bacterium]|nr:RNA-binding S4 domain-containing protein [candidate division Zixibacteria bacterium]
MRLDLYLSTTGLVKRRTLARQLCDGGKIKLNDKSAKAGKEIKVGDLIGMSLSSGFRLVEVTDLPAKSIPKKEGGNYYIIKEFIPKERDNPHDI